MKSTLGDVRHPCPLCSKRIHPKGKKGHMKWHARQGDVKVQELSPTATEVGTMLLDAIWANLSRDEKYVVLLNHFTVKEKK